MKDNRSIDKNNSNKNAILISNWLTLAYTYIIIGLIQRDSTFRNSYIPWIWQGVSTGDLKFPTMSDFSIS